MHKSLLVLHIGQEFFVVIGTSLCLLYISYQIIEGSKDIGDLILIQSFLILVYAPLKNMGAYYETIKQSLIDSEGIITLLDQQSDILDKPNAIVMKECIGKVNFENVCFKYQSSVEDVINNICFEIPAGKTLGIVGHTGSGKSTISKLMYRLYDVTSGEILIDGINIKELTINSFRKHIGVVPQDCCLFNDSIAYNIGYAQESTLDKIKWAANRAQIHDFIEGLPNGYDTIIGEKGIRLSGGEKQRVAIARALLKNPKILCFDEATSALDSITEDLIHESIKKITENTTTIIIAHRLCSVVHSHNIIVLDNGMIIERGNHAELLKLQGKYSELWNQQINDNKNS